MPRPPKAWINGGLLTVCCLLALGLAELGARWLTRAAWLSRRQLFWSEPNFALDAHGVVRFAPNALVREVAVYDGAIEFDREYHTNDLGFVDPQDYLAPERTLLATPARRFAFVGNSFTAGSGGYAWSAALRARLERSGHPVALYNFGLPGAGTEHFARILESVADSLRFTDIVIVAISNDLKRPVWTPRTRGGRIFFRFETERGPADLEIGRVISRTATPEEILQLADAAHASAEAARGSRLLALLKWGWAARAAAAKPADLAPFRRIRRRFPEAQVSFVHLPSKDEVSAGHYEEDLKSRLEPLGIRYLPALEVCSWSRQMFYAHDRHPNDSGYKNIEDCVGRLVFGGWGPLGP